MPPALQKLPTRTLGLIALIVAAGMISFVFQYDARQSTKKIVESNRELQGPDNTDGRVMLEFGYYIKDGQIYHRSAGRPLSGVDMDTFRPISEDCAKDKDNGYIRNEVVQGSVADSFVCLGGPYTKDDFHVFFGYTNAVPIDGADPISFETFSDDVRDRDGHYIKDANTVFYSTGVTISKVDLDSKTFVLIGGDYARDNQKVFFKNSEVFSADVATFRFIEERNKMYTTFSYGADKYRTYENGRPLP